MTNLELEEWKVATDEAMHFNDLLMRNRQIGFTIILAILWASTLVEGVAAIGNFEFSNSIVIAIIAIIFTLALWFIDLNYYFRLLLGAVDRSIALEKKLGFDLTKSISRKVTRCRAWTSLHLFYLLILLCNAIFLFSLFLKIE